jgi:hypothetical protein
MQNAECRMSELCPQNHCPFSIVHSPFLQADVTPICLGPRISA